MCVGGAGGFVSPSHTSHRDTAEPVGTSSRSRGSADSPARTLIACRRAYGEALLPRPTRCVVSVGDTPADAAASTWPRTDSFGCAPAFGSVLSGISAVVLMFRT